MAPFAHRYTQIVVTIDTSGEPTLFVRDHFDEHPVITEIREMPRVLNVSMASEIRTDQSWQEAKERHE